MKLSYSQIRGLDDAATFLRESEHAIHDCFEDPVFRQALTHAIACINDVRATLTSVDIAIKAS